MFLPIFRLVIIPSLIDFRIIFSSILKISAAFFIVICYLPSFTT